MGLVALTAGLFALGVYIGRDTSAGWAICWFLVAFAALLAMNPAVQRSEQLAVGLLFGFGLLLGLGVAPTVAYYVGEDPQAVWLAGGATALFVAGFGAVGYATRRDLSVLARLFWALVALIVFGIVLVSVEIANGGTHLRGRRSPMASLRGSRRWHRNRALPATDEAPDPGLDGRDAELEARPHRPVATWHRSDAAHIPTRGEIVDKRAWIILGVAEAICVAALVLAALTVG